MTYQDQVEAAATALVRGDDANWELARLTYENTKAERGYGNEPGRVTMERWCEDVRSTSGRRFAPRTGRHYRTMWESCGRILPQDRPSWADAVAERHPDQSYGPVRERLAFAEVRHGTPETKAALFTELAADPDIQSAAEAHGPVRHAAAALTAHVQARETAWTQERGATDPVIQALDEKSALLDLDDHLRRFARGGRPILSRLSTIPAAERDPLANLYFLRDALAEVREFVREVEQFVLGSQDDADARMRVLAGGRDG